MPDPLAASAPSNTEKAKAGNPIQLSNLSKGCKGGMQVGGILPNGIPKLPKLGAPKALNLSKQKTGHSLPETYEAHWAIEAASTKKSPGIPKDHAIPTA